MRLQASGATDILAFIPHTLGFQPKESLVAVTLRNGQVGATLRVGVPTGEDAPDPMSFALFILRYLSQDTEANGVLLALYTDEPGAGDQPFEEHMGALVATLAHAGLDTYGFWLVTKDYFQGYLCGGDECCPRQPVSAIADSALNAEMVFAGSGYTEDATVTIPECADPEAAEHALAVMSQHVMPAARLDWMYAVTTGKLATQDAYQIITNLNGDLALRDRLMADLIDTTDGDAAMGAALTGELTERPDWNRIRLGYELLMKLLEHAPKGKRAPILTGLGWIEWIRGRSSTAEQFFLAATEDQDGYRLASLLLQTLQMGMLPAVAMNQSTAWDKSAQ